MKTLFLLVCLIAVIPLNQVSASPDDSLELIRINNELSRQKEELESYKGQLKEQSHNIDTNIKLIQQKQSFYTDHVKSLTAIFAFIVSIAIFLAGWVIPKKEEKKYEEKVEKLRKEFNEIETRIKQFIKESEIEQDKNAFRTSRSMFHVFSQSNQFATAFLWIIRALDKGYAVYKNVKQENSLKFLQDFVGVALRTIENTMVMPDGTYVEEINDCFKRILEIEKDKDVIENLNKCKKRFNELAWKTSNEKKNS